MSTEIVSCISWSAWALVVNGDHGSVPASPLFDSLLWLTVHHPVFLGARSSSRGSPIPASFPFGNGGSKPIVA